MTSKTPALVWTDTLIMGFKIYDPKLVCTTSPSQALSDIRYTYFSAGILGVVASKHGQGKGKARARQGQGKGKARARQGQGKRLLAHEGCASGSGPERVLGCCQLCSNDFLVLHALHNICQPSEGPTHQNDPPIQRGHPSRAPHVRRPNPIRSANSSKDRTPPIKRPHPGEMH